MEEVDCHICDSDDSRVIHSHTDDNYIGDKSIDITFVLCNKCGLVYQTPRLTEEELKNLYPETYRKNKLPNPSYYTFRANKSDTLVKWLDGDLTHRDSVFDIGCATGDYLFHFNRLISCKVAGIEPTTLYADYARDEYKLDVSSVMFEDFKPTNKFSFITLFHTLEHFRDPINKLKRIKSMLKPEGKLLVEVPSITLPKYIPKEFFGSPHMYIFSPHTLTRVLNRAGFFTTKQNLTTNELSIMFLTKKYNRSSFSVPKPEKDNVNNILRGIKTFEMMSTGFLQGVVLP